jgi:hypothetical protein
MGRLNLVIDRLVEDKGLYIKADYVALKNLVAPNWITWIEMFN